MFVRSKRSGQYEYLQVVHNERREGRVRQRVVATLGRLDVLQETGQLDALLASCARFAEHSAVLTVQRQGRVSAVAKVRIGPALVFGRLWEELGLPRVLGRLLGEPLPEGQQAHATPFSPRCVKDLIEEALRPTGPRHALLTALCDSTFADFKPVNWRELGSFRSHQVIDAGRPLWPTWG